MKLTMDTGKNREKRANWGEGRNPTFFGSPIRGGLTETKDDCVDDDDDDDDDDDEMELVHIMMGDDVADRRRGGIRGGGKELGFIFSTHWDSISLRPNIDKLKRNEWNSSLPQQAQLSTMKKTKWKGGIFNYTPQRSNYNLYLLHYFINKIN